MSCDSDRRGQRNKAPLLKHDVLANLADQPGEDDLAALRALTITPMWLHLMTTIWTPLSRLSPHWSYRLSAGGRARSRPDTIAYIEQRRRWQSVTFIVLLIGVETQVPWFKNSGALPYMSAHVSLTQLMVRLSPGTTF